MNQNVRNKLVLKDKRTLILAAILTLWILVLWIQSGPSISETNASRRAAAGSSTSAKDPELLAWKLGQEIKEIPPTRNIFVFHQSAPPAPVMEEEQSEAVQPPPAVCGNQSCEEGEDYQNCPTDCAPPPPPPPPPIILRYIGYLSDPRGSVAFLTDGSSVFMGRVNDIIANKYRILKITEEDVELGYLNLNQSSTIRFEGNQGG